jgi:gluconate 2-dehydrogenase alpha chain
MTDVVLVGLGAANAIAADLLTAAGLDVTALEAGPHRHAEEMTLDEVRNDVRQWLAEPKAAHEQPVWRAAAGAPEGPPPFPTLMVNAVGGTAIHYPGLSARLNPWSFVARTRARERYGADAIPAGSTLADWPLGYDELAPFYDRVEHDIGVAGDASGDPFGGPRSRGYPMAPLRRTGWTALMDRAARERSWHPYPAPAAINAEPFNGNPACTYCGFCTASGFHRDAKGTADVTSIPRALATGRLRIVTDARVLRVETGADGRATGVTYVRDGERRTLAARAVLIGTFTYENTRLLLLSRSDAHPRGLGNARDQVGRHFTLHVTPFAFGLFDGRDLGLYSGPWAQATCLDDFNADNFDHAGLGFLGGGLCTAAHELKPIQMALAPLPPRVPKWGSGYKAWLARAARSVGSVNGQFESLTYASNRLDLAPQTVDRDGVPVVRITFAPGENERRGHDFLMDKLSDWLRAAGAPQVWGPPTEPHLPMDGRHSYGGTRMGDDPAGAVLDRWGFVHDAPNVGVLGASAFPTPGGVNPTLTVQALAWRTAAHLASEWRARTSV